MGDAVLRRARLWAVLTVALITVAGMAGARADETTIGGSVDRGNWDAVEPGLTGDAVSQADFGQIFDQSLPRPAGQDATTFPNQVYDQPIVAAGRLIVATEENQVDALDPERVGTPGVFVDRIVQCAPVPVRWTG